MAIHVVNNAFIISAVAIGFSGVLHCQELALMGASAELYESQLINTTAIIAGADLYVACGYNVYTAQYPKTLERDTYVPIKSSIVDRIGVNATWSTLRIHGMRMAWWSRRRQRGTVALTKIDFQNACRTIRNIRPMCTFKNNHLTHAHDVCRINYPFLSHIPSQWTCKTVLLTTLLLTTCTH